MPGLGHDELERDFGVAEESMATNNRPLPRNTVAKKRSSCVPIRSRITPMNHRKAIPANGTRFSPIATAVLFPESVSHVPGTADLAGTEILSRTSDEIRSAEKAMPATAAARGVLRALLAASGPWPAGPSVMGVPFHGRVLTFRPRRQASLSWPLPWVTAG